MSDADRVAVRHRVESTYGALETGNKFTNDRLTSESFGQDATFIQSNELVTDRQVSDLIRAGLSGGGTIEGELSYGAYDDFLYGTLFSSGWGSAVNSTETTYSMIASDNSINDSASAFISDGFLANQWIHVTGFTGNTANNGYYKIASIVAGKLVLSGGTVVDDAAGESVTISMGAQIVNGTTLSSWNIEKQFADLTNEYEIMTGAVNESFSVSVTPEQIVTCGFDFLAQDSVTASATTGDGSPTAAATNPIFNAIDDVVAILEGYAAYGSTNFNLTVNNNLRSRLQIGQLGAISIGAGKCVVTGNISAYFTTPTVMDKFLNNTVSNLAIVLKESGSNNSYVIELPSVKYTNGRRVAGGTNSDIIANLDFTAYKDATEAITIRIARFVA